MRLFWGACAREPSARLQQVARGGGTYMSEDLEERPSKLVGLEACRLRQDTNKPTDFVFELLRRRNRCNFASPLDFGPI